MRSLKINAALLLPRLKTSEKLFSSYNEKCQVLKEDKKKTIDLKQDLEDSLATHDITEDVQCRVY